MSDMSMYDLSGKSLNNHIKSDMDTSAMDKFFCMLAYLNTSSYLCNPKKTPEEV